MSDLNLEKMKIDDRLHSVELQTARLVAHLESESGTLKRFHQDIVSSVQSLNEIIKKHDKIIMGDDGIGLVVKIDRLEKIEEDRKWTIRVIGSSVLAILTKIVFDIVKKSGG